MTAKTETHSGIQYGWALGESNWNTGMDSNLTNEGTARCATDCTRHVGAHLNFGA